MSAVKRTHPRSVAQQQFRKRWNRLCQQYDDLVYTLDRRDRKQAIIDEMNRLAAILIG